MNIVYIGLGIVFLLLIFGKMNSKRQKKNKQLQVIVENCSGCLRCVKRCRHNVLEMVTEDDVTHVIIKNPDNCSACGNCIGVCKFKALLMRRKIGNKLFRYLP